MGEELGVVTYLEDDVEVMEIHTIVEVVKVHTVIVDVGDRKA